MLDENTNKEVTSNVNDIKKPTKNSKINVFQIISITFIALALILFVIGLILIFVLDTNIGNYIMFGFGLFSALLLISLPIILLIQKKNRCNVCGGKLKVTYEYLGSSKEITKVDNLPNRASNYKLFKFTHHYAKVITCMDCNKIIKKEFTSDGGTYIKYYDGRILDNRIKPKYKKGEQNEK